MSLRSNLRNSQSARRCCDHCCRCLPCQSRRHKSASASLSTFHVAPPALPVYEQPPLPAPGYLWTPGYWSYGDAGYFWVPGVWVQPPSAGLSVDSGLLGL